jgi:hypothetical protein
MLVTVIGVLIGLSLINSGIVASEKMQLQNAADATAYSISTLEARDLNFTAYTNRAMVANEVAMGQMVGMMSWAVMINSTPEFLNLYFTPIFAIPIIGQAIMAVVQPIISVLRAVTRIIRTGVQAFTRVVAKVLPIMNKAYSVAQRAMHLGTLYFAGMTLFDTMEANADDASLSLYGYLMLARHVNTYFGDLSFDDDSFVTSYRQSKKSNLIPQRGGDPSSDAQKEGMQKLAALINASRDPFGQKRDCSANKIFGGICDESHGGWDVPIPPFFPLRIALPDFYTPRICIKWIGCTPRICIWCDVYASIKLGMARKGGSDLRYKAAKKENHYLWTAGDSIGMATRIQLSARVFGLQVVPGFLRDIRADAPLGIGAAQAASRTDQATVANRLMVPDGLGGKVLDTEFGAYGSSPWVAPVTWAWLAPLPGDGGPAWAAQRNNINTSYPGLPRYNETKAGPDPIKIDKNFKFGFEAPYLVIALEKDMDDLHQSSTKGRFKLEANAAEDKLGVIGKSEVYFSRPSDLSYFARQDGNTELANAFNPYWQARLVDTSYLDRSLALAVQQQQLWIPAQITAALTSLKNLFKAIF